VQFHTPASRAARDLTYPDYQRLRSADTTDADRAAIMASLRAAYAGEPAASAPPAERQRGGQSSGGQSSGGQSSGGQSPGWRSRLESFRGTPDATDGGRVTYYAIADRYSSPDAPAGVLRRVEHAGGQRDEAFGRDLRWRHTFLLYSWERGNLDNSLREIGTDLAARLTDQIRREVTRTRRDLMRRSLAGPGANAPDAITQVQAIARHSIDMATESKVAASY
jgi:hypothetical protein